MTNPKIDLVVCDLDGTLLDSSSRPPQRNLQALHALHQRGIRCAIASGRDVYSIRKMVTSWGAEETLDLIIGQNGAEIMEISTGKVTTSHMVPAAVFQEVIEHFQSLEINFCVAKDGVYIAPKADRNLALMEEIGKFEVGIDPDFQTLFRSPQTKLHLMCPPDQMKQVREHAKSFSHPLVKGVSTGPYLYEYQHRDLSKAAGVKTALKVTNLPLDAGIMAFGDAENDLEMISEALVGVAMKNACEEVKAVAFAQTDTNDRCGVARFLESWFELGRG
ncbi:HAD family hydrolase [Actinomycetaceae bacterium TAE3-ERU4]|nr:HAD family hydrolase [Actinomycetaceae bacterium TAE3-ERU4]